MNHASQGAKSSTAKISKAPQHATKKSKSSSNTKKKTVNANVNQDERVAQLLAAKQKLPIKPGRADDKYEREADAVASKVVSLVDHQPSVQKAAQPSQAKTAQPIVQNTSSLNIQRMCSKCEEDIQLKADDSLTESLDEQVSIQNDQADLHQQLLAVDRISHTIQQIRQGGDSLEDREYFENRMGYDFSAVRIHRDARSQQLAKQLGAKAFTHGQHIVFAEGYFAPQTREGKKLLAHELTHVVQQGAASDLPFAQQMQIADVQHTTHNVQADLIDDNSLLGRGLNVLSDTASAAGDMAVSGARTVGRGIVRGAEYVGEKAMDAYESVRDFVMDWLEENAPELLSFLQGDIVGLIKDKITESLDYLFNGFGSKIQEEGLVNALSEVFGEFTGTVQTIATDLAAGNCESLFSAFESIAAFGERLLGPAFDELRSLLNMAGEFFGELWTEYGKPFWDAIKGLAGSAWTWIKEQADWVWEQTAGIREFGSTVWNEFKRLFNVTWDGAGDLLSWIKDEAKEAWEKIKEFLGPALLPLQIAGGIFLLFTPFGPIVAIGVGVPLLWQAIGWLRENWDDLQIVITAKEILATQILPTLQAGLAIFQGFLAGASAWLSAQVTLLANMITQALNAIGAMPLLNLLYDAVSKLASLVSEAMDWIGETFVALLDDLKELAASFLKFIQPLAVLLFAVMMFPVNPWILVIVLTGWAWRFLPDCFKPPIIDFWLETAVSFVQAMPDFEMFGPVWPEAKTKIIEALQNLQAMDTDSKIEGSNRIAKMMTGEDFTWIANLARAAWQMPSHFMGEVEKELIGQDLNEPLPIERLPEDALDATSGQSIDAAAALLEKDNLTDQDVEVDPVAFSTWHPDLIRELNVPDGGEVFLGEGMSPDIASPEGVANELAEQDAESGAIDGGALEGGGVEGEGDVEPIPTDPEEQLTYLENQDSGINCDDKEKTEEPAKAQDVPAFARRFGPFTPMQRLRYTLSQMGKGISKWFDCNKHWVVPTLILAIVALIVAIVVTEGAALGVLASVLEIVAAVMIGVSLVRMTASIGNYISLGIAGKIGKSAKALAKGLAIGAIELIFALMFSLGPIVKSARAGFKTARAAGKGVTRSLGAGARSGMRETGVAARSAFAPSFEATAKVGSAVRRSASVGARNMRQVGGAIIRNGKLVINGVQDGLAAGMRNMRQFRRSLSRLRFNGFSVSREGAMFFLWGHFNPKVLVLVGPGHFEDVSMAGTGVRPQRGIEVPIDGRRRPGVMVQVFDGSDRNLIEAFQDLTRAEQRQIVVQLQNAADDAARRKILAKLVNSADDLGFPTTTQAMRDAVQNKQFLDPFSNKMATAPSGTLMSPDHLFPVSKIREMDGFAELTLDQQRRIIQDTNGIVDNIRPLPKNMNESKGNLVGGNWTNFHGQPLNAQYIQDLAKEQALAQARIQAKIDEFLGR